jgi:hypothetical protein
MVLTEIPPSIVPTLNVVFGEWDTGIRVSSWIRPAAA